jgi:polyisoprenoid-binding protein YceI
VRRIAASVLSATLALGCGQPVQRAIIGVPRRAAAPAPAPATDAVAAQGWIITPSSTRLELHAWSAFVGDQTFTFRRFRAKVVGGETFSIHAEIETESLEGGMAWMVPIVKERLLETDLYPRATFDATARRVAGTADACVVEGILTLHGRTRAVRFDARAREERGALRLVAAFVVPRQAFGVVLADSWDSFVPDEIRVVLDVHARRERVSIEELP